MYTKNFEETPQSISLQKLISQMIDVYQPLAVRQASFIVNDVSPALQVNTSKKVLATLSGTLFRALLEQSWNTCIRVTARIYNNVVLFSIKINEGLDAFQAVNNKKEIKLLAEKLGGCISINDLRNKRNIITLSFIHYPAA